ncbi:class IV adenylate cyclase [Haloparvum sedimenti]|uniref:class IV adenylate cyclase n=1 Tax=Haloparvum sedimenti TaxID=1678448 RepID=UPI00071E7C7D|nr:class IV adenylate cyclase [Haloparvum sedimenti]
MYEVELKVPADLDAVRERLEAAGAQRETALEQVDTYYDAPDRDFAETDEALRLREETPLGGESGSEDGAAPTTKVTYKGPLVDDDSKSREEHETAVADGSAMAGVLEGLGYEPAATVRKERTFYAFEELTVTLDAVDEVGEYVEVETTVATEAEVPVARDRAAAALRDLGLDPADAIRTSYLGMRLAGE